MDFFDSLAKLARTTASEVERRVDEVKESLVPRDQSDFHLQAYRGYGTDRGFYVAGRALWGRAIDPARHRQSILDNVFDAFRRFESDEIADAEVTLRFGTAEARVRTDEEGHFSHFLEVHPDQVSEARWQSVECTLQPPEGGERRFQAAAEILLPGPTARYGVISDVDDTVMITGAANLLSIFKLTVLNNARTRAPFTGVDGLYRALAGGSDDHETNPVFYVSSSPHNLYDMLDDFFQHQGLPKGPILLRDIGLTPEQWFKAGHGEHKRAKIDRILRTYPHLDFVLIGDSGQEDPEIYATVAAAYPGRIRVIYIRDVSDGARAAKVAEVAERTTVNGTPMILAADSRVAARDAVEHGLIDQDGLQAVAQAFERDMDRPTTTEATADVLTPDLGGGQR